MLRCLVKETKSQTRDGICDPTEGTGFVEKKYFDNILIFSKHFIITWDMKICWLTLDNDSLTGWHILGIKLWKPIHV